MWLNDPASNKPSVTLTLLVLNALACFVAAGFHMVDKVSHTSILLEMFWGLMALYMGRRVSFKSKNYNLASGKHKE